MAKIEEFIYPFTVFTPTYNRAELLKRVFKSLEKQTFKHFEWIIVDDGSIDNTSAVVDEFKKTAQFPIEYHWKPNGGKHTAINYVVKIARGYFLAEIDSDDWYADNALERLLYHWNKLEDEKKNKLCGICGLFAYEDGSLVGSRFPADIFDSTDIEIIYVHKVKGDKIGINRIDVLKEFPFPEDFGNFVTEATVWNRKGMKYPTRFINEVIAYKEYQKKGLTDNGRMIAIQNALSSTVVLRELLECGITLPIDVHLKTIINYIRYSIHSQQNFIKVRMKTFNKIWLLICMPISALLFLRDLFYMRRKNNL